MPQVPINFDDSTLTASGRTAAGRAVKDESFRLETERMRLAYLRQPDSADGADTWELADEWKE